MRFWVTCDSKVAIKYMMNRKWTAQDSARTPTINQYSKSWTQDFFDLFNVIRT